MTKKIKNKNKKTQLRTIPDLINTPEQDTKDKDTTRHLFDHNNLGHHLNETKQQITDLRTRLNTFETNHRTTDPHREPKKIASHTFDTMLDALLDTNMYETINVVHDVQKQFSL